MNSSTKLDQRAWAKWLRSGAVVLRPPSQRVDTSWTNCFACGLTARVLEGDTKEVEVRQTYDDFVSAGGGNTGRIKLNELAAQLLLQGLKVTSSDREGAQRPTIVIRVTNLERQELLSHSEDTHPVGDIHVSWSAGAALLRWLFGADDTRRATPIHRRRA